MVKTKLFALKLKALNSHPQTQKHTNIRGETVQVFVLNSHGTDVMVRCMQLYEEYV